MRHFRFTLTILISVIAVIPTFGQQKPDPCPMKFSIAITDSLGNIDRLAADDQKWVEKLLKHDQGMCYLALSPDVKVLLSIAISEQVEQVVPRVANIPFYTLQIIDSRNGSPKVVRIFQRKAETTNGSVTGLIRSMANPKHQIIEDAVNWIASANIDLSDAPAPKTQPSKDPRTN